jgi:hypothetical protein
LTPGSSESVLNRYLGMFVPCIIRRCIINNDVFVRRYCQPNVDLKSAAVTVLMAWSDYGDAATSDTFIVRF